MIVYLRLLDVHLLNSKEYRSLAKHLMQEGKIKGIENTF